MPSGVVLRECSVVSPTIQQAMEQLQEEKEDKKNAEDKRQHQLRMALLASLDVPDSKPGECKICQIPDVMIDTVLTPCGHSCCKECWKKSKKTYEDKIFADLSLEDIQQKLNEPPCPFCRKIVANAFRLFL